ncbi:Cobyrinic acid a,c-diamide synthetase [hydrothermal vent metagenome]|uniref:Cobyrinic acid a,c-diamide synthetase n=1 Tax=hydrothermal vent metagenome TaxID=652676 RepID=A0A3B1DUL7_9ZZZZ
MFVNKPKIIIAGTHSGVGKTSVSLAVMAGLTKAGYHVQPYKVGPDYIDPDYHQAVTGYASHNLDSWLLKTETVQWLFQTTSQNCDIAVIEGVMGLYDGFSSTDDFGSTAQIAKLLKAPVILVVDAKSMARSVSAIIKGYQTLDSDIHIAGVILNKVSSLHHAAILKESIAFYNKIPVMGCVPKDERVMIPERYLGLQTASENSQFKSCEESLLAYTFMDDAKELGVNLKNILTTAKTNLSSLDIIEEENLEHRQCLKNLKKKSVRIAYAKDEAFQFYYQANLDFLETCGVELIPFSPLHDRMLPNNIHGLYFGGGFPEMHAQRIEKNITLRHAIKELIDKGIPTYAECGGLIYLAEKVKDLEGKCWEMTRAISGTIEMTSRLQNFGYCENTFLQDTFLGDAGDSFRGHEFHYSQWSHEGCDSAYRVEKKRRKSKRNEGYFKNNILASYIHCHFLSSPQIAINFITSSQKWNHHA